jgi:rhodanese-related sulfurtransferase
MKLTKDLLIVSILSLCGVLFGATARGEESGLDIFQAVLIEPEQKTQNISTKEMQQILAESSAKVFDARRAEEYAFSHLPGVLNARTIPVINGILQGNKDASIVLYCNGKFCGQSRRLANKLLAAGYTDIRRYQLGLPVWRALGGVTEIESEGVRYVAERDKTAVLLDAREPDEFKDGSLPGARNLPSSGVKLDAIVTSEGGRTGGGEELKKAKKDGRLPISDRNTRIIVFGKDGAQARIVAEAVITQAFHNTAYFSGTFENLKAEFDKTTWE